MSKIKQKKPNSMFVLIIILIVLIVTSFIISLTGKKKNNNVQTEQNITVSYEKIEEVSNQEELQKIKAMNERTRIEYYVSKYMKLIENEEYEEAYGLLNRDYKKNYFKTQKEFADYCKNTFPRMADISYDNFERNGDIYVVWISVGDAINGSKDSAKTINFVVKENDFNDYELSFSKI